MNLFISKGDLLDRNKVSKLEPRNKQIDSPDTAKSL